MPRRVSDSGIWGYKVRRASVQSVLFSLSGCLLGLLGKPMVYPKALSDLRAKVSDFKVKCRSAGLLDEGPHEGLNSHVRGHEGP